MHINQHSIECLGILLGNGPSLLLHLIFKKFLFHSHKHNLVELHFTTKNLFFLKRITKKERIPSELTHNADRGTMSLNYLFCLSFSTMFDWSETLCLLPAELLGNEAGTNQRSWTVSSPSEESAAAMQQPHIHLLISRVNGGIKEYSQVFFLA
jgi:hypothetical protein